MIRDLFPLNPLTASRNAIDWGILATGHVILERDRITQPCQTYKRDKVTQPRDPSTVARFRS